MTNIKQIETIIRLINLFFGLLLVPTIFLLPFTIFMFDAPGSSSNFPTLMLLFSFLSFPVLTLISFFYSRKFVKVQRHKHALLAALSPAISIIIFIFFIIILEIFSNGRFAE